MKHFVIIAFFASLLVITGFSLSAGVNMHLKDKPQINIKNVEESISETEAVENHIVVKPDEHYEKHFTVYENFTYDFPKVKIERDTFDVGFVSIKDR